MKKKSAAPKKRVTIERTYDASVDEVWELWTTRDGIESWWGPDGFAVTVQKLELKVGGELHYTMTAVGPQQIAFMKQAGMPLANPSRIVFTDVRAPHHLAYTHDTTFIQDVDPYDVATNVDLTAVGDQTRMVLTFDVMHDAMWTERATAGWTNEVEKLRAQLQHRHNERKKKMQKITPFLWFDGNLEEAVSFYVATFANSRVVDMSPGPDGKAFSARFILEGQPFLALNGGPMYKFTEAISLYVDCTTQDEVDRLWSRLIADGGSESRCGWLKDRFGLSWQIIPALLPKLMNDPDRARSQRVVAAMMKMNKIILADLQAAYDG